MVYSIFQIVYLKDISSICNVKPESFTIKLEQSESRYSFNELNVHFKNDQVCKAWYYGLESILKGENIIVDEEGKEELRQLICNEIHVRLMTLDLYRLETPEYLISAPSLPPDPIFE